MGEQVVIDSRFCGPPDFGNGGYTCGIIANFIEGAAEVILRRPPPLNRSLNVDKIDGDKVVLHDQNGTIAEAIPTKIELDIPKAPSFSEAKNSAIKVDKIENHPFPTCFVCGHQRAESDGLRIFPGPVEGKNYLAAAWIPTPSLSDDTGKIRNEIVWATLDCPGGWAIVIEQMRFIVLGKLVGQITNRIKPCDKCVVISWKISEEGRKIFAGSALFSDTGQLCAKAKATWIELKPTS